MAARSVNWAFFTDLPKPVGESSAAGWRTRLSVRSSCWHLRRLIGIPIGVLGGVYLAEYGIDPRQLVLRFIADVLNGVPSIIWGVVVYGLVVSAALKVSPLMPADWPSA